MAAGLRWGGLTARAPAWTPWCWFQVIPLTCTISHRRLRPELEGTAALAGFDTITFTELIY